MKCILIRLFLQPLTFEFVQIHLFTYSCFTNFSNKTIFYQITIVWYFSQINLKSTSFWIDQGGNLIANSRIQWRF